MKQGTTMVIMVASALTVLVLYGSAVPMSQVRDDLPPELSASPVNAEEIALTGEELAVTLDLTDEAHALANVPQDTEVEIRLRQVDGVLQRTAREHFDSASVILPRNKLEEALEQSQSAAAVTPGGGETPGVVDLEFWVEGERIASRPIAITVPHERSPGSPVFRWSLHAADAVYRPGHFFEVPVHVLPQVDERGRTRNYRLEKPATVLVRDLEGGMEPREIKLPKGRFMSAAIPIPLRPQSRYRLVAEPVGNTGAPSEPVVIDWASHGPNLRLEVLPAAQSRFASRTDPAHLRLFVSYAGSRVKPPPGARLTTNPPPGVVLEPSPPELDEHGVWSTAAYAGATLPAARIEFSDIDFGLSTAAQIDFRYPLWQLACAVLAGAFGVLIARRKQLFEMGRLAAALEITTSMAGAGLLYAALVAGWLPPIPGLLALVPAIAIGLLGGYAGEGTFQLLIKRLLPKDA